MKTYVSLLPLLLPLAAEGAVLVQYSFPVGNYANETGDAYVPTTTDPGISAGNLLDGTGMTIRSKNGPDPSVDVPNPPPTYSSFVLKTQPVTGSTSLAAAVTNDAYVHFTVTGNLNLTGLTFDAARGGSGVRGFTVRSSVDNFATDLLTDLDIDTAQPVLTPYSLDLTGAEFQGLSSVTFRIYTFNTAANQSIDIDNITLNGVVPEPSSFLLVAAGGALVWRRNRPHRG